MIQLYECPNCGKDSAAFTSVGEKPYCPACAPPPGTVPHDFKRPERADFKVTATEYPIYVSRVTCCSDAADCGHDCGVA